MLLLALDTAGPNCAVALARPGATGPEVLVRVEKRIERGHAEALMPMIEAALGDAQASFASLGRIAVTTGPGSFTGVRIGIAAARGLALALDIPTVGVGSLAALAFPATQSGGAGTVAAVLNARRGEVYAFAQDIASSAVLVEAVAARVENLALWLRGAAPPLILTGSGAPLLAAALPAGDIRIAGTAETPDIVDVAALGLMAEVAGPPMPIYVRGADAKAQGEKAVARQ